MGRAADNFMVGVPGAGGAGTGLVQSPAMETSAEPILPDGESTIRALFTAIDAGDVERLVSMFSPDAAQRIGNTAWTHGREAIRAGNTAFLARIDGLHHEITGLWDSAGSTLVRSEVRYDLPGGESLTIPSMTVFTRHPDGLIDTFQVWSDTSALLS